jgi:hypothetical protein
MYKAAPCFSLQGTCPKPPSLIRSPTYHREAVLATMHSRFLIRFRVRDLLQVFSLCCSLHFETYESPYPPRYRKLKRGKDLILSPKKLPRSGLESGALNPAGQRSIMSVNSERKSRYHRKRGEGEGNMTHLSPKRLCRKRYALSFFL